MAVGVANPKAQGQAMINTPTIFKSAKVKADSPGPQTYQAANVATAIIKTAGTK